MSSKPFWVFAVTANTLADSATPYSYCATPYTIGLWRKLKSCDQKHGCLLKIFSPPKGSFWRSMQNSSFFGFQDCNCMVSRCATPYIVIMWPIIFFYVLYCMVSRYRTAWPRMKRFLATRTAFELHLSFSLRYLHDMNLDSTLSQLWQYFSRVCMRSLVHSCVPSRCKYGLWVPCILRSYSNVIQMAN